jgi:hypothetical protein
MMVEQVRQESAARREARPAVSLGHDVQVLDLEEIPGFAPFT